LRYVKNFQKSNKKILAIGDGVNDAPLLAMANVSIAIGDAAPLSQSGADLILFNHRLSTISFALIHAKNTQVIIRQNLIWGLTYNLIALPLAIFGYVSPLGAAVGMSVSSIVVCLNSARLSKTKNRYI
jgi:Cu2+-exporting ATPase